MSKASRVVVSKASKRLQASVFKALARWFAQAQRVLPWRSEPTLYRVWISEIMLQQTQVATVIPYFERFLKTFPDVNALASAPLEKVLLGWAGLGYYSRARNLHRAAQAIAQKGFPQTQAEWLEIPGVGPYTAGAICSIALNQPEALLDGNVERVLSRFYRVPLTLEGKIDKETLWGLAREWIQKAHALEIAPRDFNQALMELGATVCLPVQPICESCPLKGSCEAHLNEQTHLFPPPRKRPSVLQVQEQLHCVLDSKNRLLLSQRAKGEWRAGLWDFLTEEEFEKIQRQSSFEKISDLHTRHVVTRHQIHRTTHVWRASQALSLKPTQRWMVYSKTGESLSLPVGSGAMKVLKALRKQI